MSGICGIIRFDGGPVFREELLRMANAAPYRGPHGTFIHCEDSVGLVYQSLEITPESVGERQPVAGPAGTLLLSDARLDNRADFLRQSDPAAAVARAAACAHDPDERPVTDAELILASLLRDPEGGPARILGDFAWALWDPRSRELRLARDAMGMRALYYRVEPGRVLFATEVKQILAAKNVPRKLNELAVAWHLTGMQTPPDQVFYEGIDSVVPGEEVRVGPDGRVHRRIFWRPNPRHRIRYRRDEEYAAHLRDLIIDAMRARLRTSRPVGVSLSGGLDSGTIACVAGWLRERDSSGAPAGGWPEMLAYTWAFTELPQCDERENVYRIASPYGIPVREIPAEETYPLIDYPVHGPDEDDPFLSVFQPFVDAVANAARVDRVSVLYQGVRGDMMCGGQVTDVHGLIRMRRFSEGRGELSVLRRMYGLSRRAVLMRYLVGPGISPLVPPVFRRRYGEPARRAAVHVSHDYLKHAELPARDPVDAASDSWRDPARRDRSLHVFSPLVMQVVTAAARRSATHGLGFADPWSDRRIAEFVLAAPQHLVTRAGDPKRIVRRALVGMMPPAARAAARKVSPGPLYSLALRDRSRETVLHLITDSHAAELGCIDSDRLLRSYQAFVTDEACNFDVWSTLSLEIWLRRFWS